LLAAVIALALGVGRRLGDVVDLIVLRLARIRLLALAGRVRTFARLLLGTERCV